MASQEVSTMKIRISLVDYLNSAPLGWAFLHGPFREGFEVIPSSPAKCAEQLSKGEVDIGLIPSIEYQRISNLRIFPDIAIAASGEVRSILLVKPREKPTIESVALDANSRTSVALTTVLLQTRREIHPKFVPCRPDLDEMLRLCDAALLIGDAALRVPLDKYDATDLAQEWVQWQKKPFVFAFWACRNDAALSADLGSVFLEAKDWGLKRRQEIASIYAGLLNLPTSFLESYLVHNIDYDMGPKHIEGLEKFYHLARRESLIPEIQPLRFFGA